MRAALRVTRNHVTDILASDDSVTTRMCSVVAPQGNADGPGRLAGSSTLDAVYQDCSPARLYAAVLQAASELGLATTSRNDAAMAVSVRAAGPTATWPGQELTAFVHRQGGGARVVVAGGSLSGLRLVMADWHRVQAIALTFLKRVASELPSVPEPVAAGPSAADQLKSLTDLRDRGFLTEEEFAAARQHLL